MSSKKLKLAISTCPNDTFAFHAILNNKIDLRGLQFEIELLDIQQLNDGLFSNRFDVAKASFHAAAKLSNETVVLPSGSALGFGVGPLLLASQPNRTPNSQAQNNPSTTLCPGEHTTAAMLFQLFFNAAISNQQTRVEHTVFSEIMPALKENKADFGVCIHEGRFTWKEEGLYCVEDLGQRWEEETNSPLPLGGILARRNLDNSLTSQVQSIIQDSIKYGLQHRDETLETMRKYAQEFKDEVLFGHVDLYVNDWTIDLGVEGQNALSLLSEKARLCGLIAPEANDIEIWQPVI